MLLAKYCLTLSKPYYCVISSENIVWFCNANNDRIRVLDMKKQFANSISESATQQRLTAVGFRASNASSSTWGDPKTGLAPQPTQYPWF
jgi:hypothetical protein